MGRSICLLLLLLCGACRESGVPFVPKADSGFEMRPCNITMDCAGAGICVAGLCQQVRSCTTDDDCAADGQVCHANRFYCVECDGTHPGECQPNFTCQFDFTCVMIGNSADSGVSECSGSCTDRSECGTDDVCKNNTCCPPPSRCFSPADCPVSQPECNGATGECFGGDGCFDDDDCDGKPGCTAGACRCDIQTAPPGTCRVREDECQNDVDC